MKKRDFVQLLRKVKNHSAKFTAITLAATLAFTSMSVTTLAGEVEDIQTEESVVTETTIVDDAIDAVEDAQDIVTDEDTDNHLADAAEDLADAAEDLNAAEQLQQEAAEDKAAMETANGSFVNAMEQMQQEADKAEQAAADAEQAKDASINAITQESAQYAVDQAGEKAQEAQDAVDKAQEQVDVAQQEYDKAYAAYQEALKKAEEAQAKVESAGTNIDGAASDVEDAAADAEAFKAEAEAALETVNKEGMSLILAQHDKVKEIYNAEGKTENYWSATRTLNNLIVEYYLLANNADVNKDSIQFGAEYDNTEFEVITGYEKNEDGTYKVDEDGNYIPVYETISYEDNKADDNGELNWIEDESAGTRTVCVYEEQERDAEGNLLFDAEGNPVMKTIVKYYTYKLNENGTVSIVEKTWGVEDSEEIIAEVPAIDAVAPIDPTYAYLNDNKEELVRDENDAKQVAKVTEDGTEVIAVPDEADNRGTTTTEPQNTVVQNGNTTISTSYVKGEENTTYAFGDTQVVNKEGTGATTVTDYDRNKDGSKDDMKDDVAELLAQYDVNAGYTINIHYETWFQDKDYTIDNYNGKANFWEGIDDWLADFFGTAEYTIEVIHTEDTVEGIIGTTAAEYTVTTTETTTTDNEKTDDGYDSRDEAKAAANVEIANVIAQYQAQLGEGSTIVSNEGGICTIVSADGLKTIEIEYAIDTHRYGFIWYDFEYELDYSVKATTVSTTTETKTIATNAYGAKYYNYTMTDPGKPGVDAVPGKDAAFGTTVVWKDDANAVVDTNSKEYQNAVNDQIQKIEDYEEAVEAANAAQEAVNDAQDEVDKAQEEYDKLKESSSATLAQLKEYEAILNAAKAKLDEAVASAESLQKVADEAKEAYEEAVFYLTRFAGDEAGGYVPTVAETADEDAEEAAAPARRTVTTQEADVDAEDAVEEEELVAIEDEEVPLAVEEELTTIEDEEVPLAVEKEATQVNFLWWILLVILAALGTLGVVKYQNDKKKKNRA